jgi:2-methylaconitate cis-trans-isomerase PrpF
VAADVRVTASLVDAGAPVVIVRATDLGITARETPAQLDARSDLLATLDAVRREGAVAMGLAGSPEEAERAVPKLAVVAAPDAAEQKAGADLVVRMLSMGRVHPALPITGSVALTLAARETGTVVSGLLPDASDLNDGFSMLTPAGLVTTSYSHDGDEPVVAAVRTYRRLVEGSIELPAVASATPERHRAIA